MKKRTILLLVLLVVLGLLGFGLQRFLTEGLTAALNNTILPAVKSEYGLDVRIEKASVTLLKGRAELHGLSVRNLEGYEEPTLLTVDSFLLKFDMMSLLKHDPIIITLAEANGVALTVERNEHRNINIQELIEKLQATAKPSNQDLEAMGRDLPLEEKVPLAVTGAAGQCPLHFRRIAIDGTVLYADPKRNRTLPMNLRLTGSDLFTVPAEGQPDSLLVLRGSLADDENAFVTDLNAIVKPLTDPANPNFNATGSVLDIDAELLKELLDKNDMASGPFSIKPSITCNRGKIKGSYIDLTLTDLEIYGAKLGDTTLPLQLKGTLQKPVFDMTAALQALFSAQSVNILKTIGLKDLGLQLGGGEPSDTTATNPLITLSDVLIEQLEKNVKEVKSDDTDALKGLLNDLFGN